MDKTYTIAEVTSVRPNAYQGSTGINFKVNDPDWAGKSISVLTKYPDKFVQGSEQFGNIVTKEKDGKTYYNFNFAKKAPQTSGMSEEQYARMDKKLDAIWTKLNVILAKIDPPKIPGTNSLYPTGEVEDLPF